MIVLLLGAAAGSLTTAPHCSLTIAGAHLLRRLLDAVQPELLVHQRRQVRRQRLPEVDGQRGRRGRRSGRRRRGRGDDGKGTDGGVRFPIEWVSLFG